MSTIVTIILFVIVYGGLALTDYIVEKNAGKKD